MENEATDTSTGAEQDTSSTGETAEGTVTDETGGVTSEEISAALGSKYKTVAPAKEESETEEEDKTNADDETNEDAEQETEAEEETPVKPAKEDKQEVIADSDAKDFSFTVEDANGTTYKIVPGDSIEDILKDFEPKNNGQIIAILDQLREAKDAQAKYETDQQTQAAEADKAERVANIQEGWNSEIKDLQAQKRIPTGTDNERIGQVYTYMGEENAKRIAAGKPTIGSFEDALDKLETIEERAAKVEANKAEKEEARKNGGLVGGGGSMTTATTGAYKAGSARNVNQALRAQGLI